MHPRDQRFMMWTETGIGSVRSIRAARGQDTRTGSSDKGSKDMLEQDRITRGGKLIGLTPQWDDVRQNQRIKPEYLDAILSAGGLPVVLPLSADDAQARALCARCDGIVLTGGPDVDPAWYGEAPLACTSVCAPRDRLERSVFSAALELDKPVLGICRGIQLINAVLGGSLIQDIPSQCSGSARHAMDAPFDRACHSVDLLDRTPLRSLSEQARIGVNSLHHQAIRGLAPGLTAMALSEDGLVEAVWMKDRRFVWAVQWHPEITYQIDVLSRRLCEACLAAC